MKSFSLPGGCDLFEGSKYAGRGGAETEQINIIQYQYLIKVLKWKLEFVGVAVAVAAFAAGDVARKCCLLIRRTHISATDKEAQECERAKERRRYVYTRFACCL